MSEFKESELWKLSATSMKENFINGLITPLHVVNSCLDRIDRINGLVNAVIARRDASALVEAVESSKRYARGEPLSALDGIPITVKDCLLTKDLPTTWGSVALKDYKSNCDQSVVAKIRKLGMIIIGKTNVCEFTLEGYTSNRLFGTTYNPWNLKLTPGGSSGGAAASVCSGMAPLALGSDAGGSIRRPASHCGLVGIKPSMGSISSGATLPQIMFDFDVVGVLGRSVADTRLLFDAIRGPALDEWRSWAAEGARRSAPSYGNRLRILYIPTLDDFPVDPIISAQCHKAIKKIRTLGHEVEIGEMPIDLSFTTVKWPIVAQLGLARLFEKFPEWRNDTSPQYLAMANKGEMLPASSTWDILESVEKLRRDAAGIFNSFDIVITPAAAALPWPAEESYPKFIDGKEVGPRGHAIFASWVNAAGLPALAVPCDPSSDNLPIGIQIVAAFGNEDLIFELACSYEKISPWIDKWPDI